MDSPAAASPRPNVFHHHPGGWLMGAHLVSQVLAHWTHLNDRAFRVLVRMAVTALDKPQNGKPAGIYHGGRELLAMTLRSEGSLDTRYRAVKRAVAELSEAGAIKHIRSGWAGQNAVYRLTLGNTKATGENVTDDEEMGGSSDPPVGGSSDPPNGGSILTEWGVPATPPRSRGREVEELQEEKAEVDLTTTSHPPRAQASADPPNVIRIYGRAADAVAEAMQRRAAAREAHRASQTPEVS